SVMNSPVLVPGVSTMKRVYGESPGADPARVPLDLDIYVDSSGSMPHPGVAISYLALAGVILALSALRAGARCQATLWSGAGQFETTAGFVRDEKRILGILTGYLGDGTAFPLGVLRKTYETRKKDDPPAHVVVISDDGADTMLQRDEKAIPGETVCARALEKARGGGTLALNLVDPAGWRAAVPLTKVGFAIHGVTKWEELIEFARAFVRDNYGKD
ncbi:MAG TPA: VWA domain-containing protein, partial [Thermoanaerobaculia bacterium]|nr:VWA domain-containing protein [Thermoanaerobaculia bacterium]